MKSCAGCFRLAVNHENLSPIRDEVKHSEGQGKRKGENVEVVLKIRRMKSFDLGRDLIVSLFGYIFKTILLVVMANQIAIIKFLHSKASRIVVYEHMPSGFCCHPLNLYIATTEHVSLHIMHINFVLLPFPLKIP